MTPELLALVLREVFTYAGKSVPLSGMFECLNHPGECEYINGARTFAEIGIRGEGIVIRMRDGSSYTVTVTKN